MFNWLKELFGKKDHAADPAFPFPKVTDQAELAPYKVEEPAVKPEVATQPAKKPVQPKKAPAKKPAGNTRGRKPKVSTVKK
jgi:hypothetical protein